MEIEMSMNSDEIQTKNNKAIRKPPTRLQARAPASLELGQITLYAATAVADSLVTPMAIPLLSPLVLSPGNLAEEALLDGDRVAGKQDDVSADDDAARSPKSPWQYSEVSSFDEPCYVFSFFNSQCVINPAQ